MAGATGPPAPSGKTGKQKTERDTGRPRARGPNRKARLGAEGADGGVPEPEGRRDRESYGERETERQGDLVKASIFSSLLLGAWVVN